MADRPLRLSRLPASHRPLVAALLRLAPEVGRLLLRRFRRGVVARAKGPADIVTVADEEAQSLIAGRLRRAFPTHGILAEEGLDFPARGEWRWIVDPLDGTKNFAHRVPSFCVSLAAAQEGRVELGAVYDPLQEEMFLGVRGHGAWLNGLPIRVSGTQRLKDAFLTTGVPHRVRRFAGSVGRTFARFAARSLGVRDRGAGALDLCYVACGRFDGYWEIDQSPWDVAAGGLIVEEAGGRMSDLRGSPFDIFSGEMLASNGRIHDEMLAVLALPGALPRRYRPPMERR